MELMINAAYSNLGEFFSLKQPTFFKFIKQFFFRPQQLPHHFDHDEYSEWHNLPSDLLGKIIKLLNVSDFTCMRYTCKSWWTESQWLLGNGGHLSLAPQHPWLLLPHAPASPHLTFMDLFEAKLRDIKLPIPVRGGWCCGSSKGWLFIAYGRDELEPDLFLVNPISGHTLPLPPISSIPGYDEFAEYLPHPYNAATFISKLELSNPSPAASNCIVAGLIYGNSSIVFCKIGGDSWILYGEQVDHNDNIRFNDIVFSSDGTKLYISASAITDGTTSRISVILDEQSTLSELEVTNGIHSSRISLFHTQVKVVLNFIPDSFSEGEALFGALQVHNNFKILEKHAVMVYLVETSKGKLLEVHKYVDVMINKPYPDLEGPEGVDEVVECSSFKYLSTTGFLVFSVDPDNGHKCRLNSLEDEDDVIFVGERGSFSLSSRDFKAGLIPRNCIYFLEDNGAQISPNISRECGVFYLKTGKIKKGIPSMQCPTVSHMVWFTPKAF